MLLIELNEFNKDLLQNIAGIHSAEKPAASSGLEPRRNMT